MTVRSRFLVVVFSLFLLTLGFGLGLVASGRTLQPSLSLQNIISQIRTSDTTADWRTFQSVWDSIHQLYVNGNVNDRALLQGATAGLVNALGDPYSVYLSAAAAQDLRDEIDGTFEGVGMEVGMKNDQLMVIAPLSSSPAAKAGIEAGDRIMAINGTAAASLSLTDAVRAIRGKKGTTVTLVVQRAAAEQKTITITRDTIKVSSVISRVERVGDRKYAYLQVTSFGSTTDQLFRTAAKDLLSQSVNGWIIDLRNNPGGLLDQAVSLASAMIADGTIVQEVDRDGTKKTLSAEGNAFLTDQPIVVLINGGSASASEIVAGALQDTGRAKLIGQKSYGKGTVQDLQTLRDGSTLKLTIAKWLTPKGRSINEEGVAPDIEITISDADTAAGRDPQLDKAKEILGQ